ncbi:PAS domain-containing sensor histidine kinase [Sandaracinobacter sp. RS1-74]|uniref:sensor histidine kinase NtrY-like n=1 Tax=Sandaracinobacteroides sayramensis TaxID=2913411 RepID=UPI001EDBD625|nr:PAS domain-containing sensor histidine kinase [Sandaracinobacteroides sayramensis]MCG2840048.1 PAS domain-containing sensor histidine kinase [Sandaracinobacteroides sayramensis]
MITSAGSLGQRAAVRFRLARRRFGRWAATPGQSAGLEIAFAAVALLVGLSSYAFLTGQRAPAEGFSPSLVALLLVANLLPLLALLFLIGRRVAILIGNRRAGRAGAQLHVRLVALFAALAAAPTILVVIFAALLFQFGVQFWFSDRAKTVLDNADRVAQAYVDENTSRILDDIVAMGRDISKYSADYGVSSSMFREGLEFQVAARNLSEAAVFQTREEGPAILVAASLDEPLTPARVAALNVTGIRPGEARAIASAKDRVEAIVRLQTTEPIFVYTSRKVEPRVLEQVARTQAAISDYKALTERSRAMQWRFNLILIVVSLLVVAAAVWFAILLATRIVEPIGELAEAAERVGKGDLNARVNPQGTGDEIGALARSFNRMTAQLKAQQQALIGANTQSEMRRRFMEAVLSGVSAGVLSIDAQGVIRLANASAEALLDCGPQGLIGRSIGEVVPEFAELLDTARTEGIAAAEISRLRPHGRSGTETQTLAVRLTADAGQARNYILTFDDISQQLADQRRAAWSDVARRIAHEIKNPLTPIILSAERLKRRFGPEIGQGKDVFDELTDTIVRQVGDLRRMVDEFSAFARMPAPTFHEESLAEIARQAIFLAEVATPHVRFQLHVPETLPPFVCDRRQIGQAFTNLLKNASEAIVLKSDHSKGEVDLTIRLDGNALVVEIADTGCGIPPELRERLFEPYVTTRQRGTGLGLAIVKRIVEDHHGRLEISNRDEGGALARMEFDLAANRALIPTPEPEQVTS